MPPTSDRFGAVSIDVVMRDDEDEGAPPDSVVVGDVFDTRWRVMREIGRRDGIVTFEAEHVITQRRAALRVALLGEGQELANDALERQTIALARIQHPGIVDLLDAGPVRPNGQRFVVLEMMRGRALDGLLDTRGKLTRVDAVALALKLCDALLAAHRAQVVHRDVCPARVHLVRGNDGMERVKLTGFDRSWLPGDHEMREVAMRDDVYGVAAILLDSLGGVSRDAGGDPLLAIVYAALGSARTADIASLASDLARVIPDAVSRELHLVRPQVPQAGGVEPLPDTIGPPPPPVADRGDGVGSTTLKSYADPPERAWTDGRVFPRVPYATPVVILAGDERIAARSEDISERGMLVLTTSQLQSGSRVALRFTLPMGDRMVTQPAVVRWIRVPRATDGTRAVGLELVDTAPDVDLAIARFVAIIMGA